MASELENEISAILKKSKADKKESRRNLKKFTKRFSDIIAAYAKAEKKGYLTDDIIGKFVVMVQGIMEQYGIRSLSEVKKSFRSTDKMEAFNTISDIVEGNIDKAKAELGIREYEDMIKAINQDVKKGNSVKDSVSKHKETFLSLITKYGSDFISKENLISKALAGSEAHKFIEANFEDIKKALKQTVSKEEKTESPIIKKVKEEKKAPLLSVSNKGNAEYTKAVQKVVGATPDGLYGSKTAEKVKAWQKAHNLASDGVFGSKSWSMLTGQEIEAIKPKTEPKTDTETEPKAEKEYTETSDPRKIKAILDSRQFVGGKRLLNEEHRYSDDFTDEELSQITIRFYPNNKLTATYQGQETYKVGYTEVDGEITLSEVGKGKIIKELVSFRDGKKTDNADEKFISHDFTEKPVSEISNEIYECINGGNEFTDISLLIIFNRNSKKLIRKIVSEYQMQKGESITDRIADEDKSGYTYGRLQEAIDKVDGVTRNLYLSIANYEIRAYVNKIIATHIKRPSLYARMLYNAMDGIGTDDQTIKMLSDIIDNEGDNFKKRIWAEWKEASGGDDENLHKWLLDDSVDGTVIDKILPEEIKNN